MSYNKAVSSNLASQSRDTNPVQVDAKPEHIFCATEKLFSEMAEQAIAKKTKIATRDDDEASLQFFSKWENFTGM